jgi:hypothetical protein
MKTLTVEEVIKNGVNYGIEIMGDDFIGYKFVGENSEFWNSILLELHNNGKELAEILNSVWLKANNVPYLEHDSVMWNS